MDQESNKSFFLSTYRNNRVDTYEDEDRPSSAKIRTKANGHRRVSTQVNSSVLNPRALAIETLSPVNSSRRNANLISRDRTTGRYGEGRRNISEFDRKPSTSSNYRIRKIGPKLLGGE